MNIYKEALQFRKQLLKHDAGAALRMMDSYNWVAERILARVDDLLREIDIAKRNGRTVRPSWLYEQRRLEQLLTQVQLEIDRWAPIAAGQVSDSQARAVDLGITHSTSMVGAEASASFSTLNTQAVTSAVGFAGDGTPLTKLFSALGPDAAKAVKNTLLEAVALGYNPKKTARRIRESLGGNMARALTISRTETLRAYREASQVTYEENQDVVKGWVWISACSSRTCSVCFAMHGSVHPVNEQFSSHVNCRCTPTPLTKGTKELLGKLASGPERFDDLETETQKNILGKAKYQAYKDGDLTLTDLIGVSNSRQWGRSLYERSLADALEDPRKEVPFLGRR